MIDILSKNHYMHKFIIVLSVCLLCLPNFSCNSAATETSSKSDSAKKAPEKSTTTVETTFILVRHAEKEKVEDDPGLTTEGLERAENLAFMLKDIPLDAIYSSDYKRTKDTAKPTAAQKNLKVNLYNPRELESEKNEMLQKHEGKTILVVGHSNSTPSFVNLLAGIGKAEKIDESVYSKLFIVGHRGQDDTDVLLLRY